MDKNESRIGQDFTFLSLLKFALPGLLTTLFVRIFETLDDGLFISRYVGQYSLAAIKLLTPCNNLFVAVAHIFSLGASTISATRFGQGKKQEANQVFTKLAISSFICGCLISLIINLFPNQILDFLGSDETLYKDALTYIRFSFSFIGFKLLSNCFASYYSVAGKPSMGLFCSIFNGVLNIALDIVMIVSMNLGVKGAALATTIGEICLSIIGLIFFANKNNEIHFVKIDRHIFKPIPLAFSYSLSQVITAISFGAVTFFSNKILLSFLANDGVAANAIVSDFRVVLNGAFIGFSTCIGPIIAYNYGSKNKERLRKILSYVLYFWFIGTLVITSAGLLLRKPVINLFMSADSTKEFYDLTYHGMTIEFFAPMFTIICVFTTRIFTSLKATKTALIISFLRNTIIRLSCILLLPQIIGADGIWYAFPVGEFISAIMCVICIYCNADNYGYGKTKVAKLIDG